MFDWKYNKQVDADGDGIRDEYEYYQNDVNTGRADAGKSGRSDINDEINNLLDKADARASIEDRVRSENEEFKENASYSLPDYERERE